MYKLLLEEIIGKMRKSVSQGEGGMYLDQVYYISSDEGILNLGTSSKFFKEKLESLGFIKKIEDELSERNGSAIKVNIEIKKQDPSKPEQNIQKRDKGGDTPKNHPDLKEEFTFSNFVISTNNELAANAAMAIAKAPGKFYNPFLIYGGVEKPKMAAFKNKYRGVDVLLIDDIHFFQGKEGVQEELFNTFNALYEVNRQIVFTCDRHPSELKNLTERMKSRFMSGLNADLKLPDFETRMAILKKKCSRLNVSIKDEVLEFISKNVTTSVRDLESALTKIVAYSDLIRREVTLDVAKEQLSYLTATKQENVSIDRIIKAVAEYFNISSGDIRGRKRTKNIAWPRQIAMYIINHLGEYSMNEIGNEFGKDHTTVIYAIQKVEDSIKSNPTLEPVIQKIEASLKDASEKG